MKLNEKQRYSTRWSFASHLWRRSFEPFAITSGAITLTYWRLVALLGHSLLDLFLFSTIILTTMGAVLGGIWVYRHWWVS